MVKVQIVFSYVLAPHTCTEKRIDYAVALNVIPMLVPGLQEKDDVLNLTLKIYLDIAAYGV